MDGDDAFLLADKNLDVQRYNDTFTDEDVTWETCTMRSWLNGYGAGANVCGTDYSGNNFINNAFTISEQEVIKNATDKVYLLSRSEAMNHSYGFTTTDKRKALNTAYVAAGGEASITWMSSAGRSDTWWLRTPGDVSDCASIVAYDGSVKGSGLVDDAYAVRPALHLNLSSNSGWSHAEKVTSDGEVEEGDMKPTGTPVIQPSVPPIATSEGFTGKLNNPRTGVDEVVTWDCVYFGNYWQEDTNGDGKADKSDAKTPIKWRVLSVDGDDAFLLADKNLDVQRYRDASIEDITWEMCTMRSWLNGYGAEENKNGSDYRSNNFLNHAFTEAERSAIKTTNVVNDDNPEYGTEGGNNTSDKVYLLSIDEVMNPDYGFTSSIARTKTREAINTAYVADGGEVGSSYMDSAGSAGDWWLRSPGDYGGSAAYVSAGKFIDYFIGVYYKDQYGYVMQEGDYVSNASSAVRPALHLDLSSASNWSYAGTVTAKGGVEETEVTEPTEPDVPEEPSSTPTTPGIPSRPGTSSVMPSVLQPNFVATPAPSISSTPEKATLGKVSALKLGQKKQTVTVSWKKLTGAKGYQICYSTSKKWKNKKQKLVTQNKAVIKKLEKKKTYYFRVRAYRLEGTKKVYGTWSGVKKIKIKK
ncbi:MAG: fibronectin type III domain-containing protein [Roseburia sp.]|nr:fibronectin type III domain-containing protein [Roseburia sp.]